MQTIIPLEEVARICHDANYRLCRELGESALPYDIAPDWQVQSAQAGVRKILDNPDITPEQVHEAWCEHKIAEGWKWGPVKDADAKEHHCLVPYADLPPLQKHKDLLFRNIVAALTVQDLSTPLD